MRFVVNNEQKVGPHEDPDEDPGAGAEIPGTFWNPRLPTSESRGGFLNDASRSSGRRGASVLFGSVVAHLTEEFPRFPAFRRAGIALPHECRDVDIAVWLDDLADLRRLRVARSRSLNELHDETNAGVAHHQVDVFLIEPGTDPLPRPPVHVQQVSQGKTRVPRAGLRRDALPTADRRVRAPSWRSAPRVDRGPLRARGGLRDRLAFALRPGVG